MLGQEKELSAIKKAIENADSKTIYQYCENSINLSLPGTNGKYSKTQAQKILGLFFEGQPVKELKTVIMNTETQENCYAILEYISVLKSYNFYIQIQKQNDHFLIQKIQIQEIKP